MLAIRTGLAVLPLCLMLAGCGFGSWLTSQLQGADEKQVAADDESCRNFGTQPGTSAYDQCRKNLDSSRQAKSSMQPASGPPAGATAVQGPTLKPPLATNKRESRDGQRGGDHPPTATPPTPTPTPTESPPTSPRDVIEGNLRKKDQASQSTSAAISASSAPSQQAASVTQSQNDPVHLQLPLNTDQVAAKIQQCKVQKCTCSSFPVSKVSVIDVYRICDKKCGSHIQCFEDCSNDWKAYNDKANAYNKLSKQVCPRNYSDN
jgi:hypothetical protein